MIGAVAGVPSELRATGEARGLADMYQTVGRRVSPSGGHGFGRSVHEYAAHGADN